VIDAAEFRPDVVRLFADARGPARQHPEAAGQAAEQAGQLRDAFLAYLSAYQALSDPAPAADDRRLREKIIKVVQRLETAPAIPSEARDHFTKAQGLIDAAAILGGSSGPGSAQAAAVELKKAIRVAPWWPDATFRLATQLQKLERFDEALLNLTLYRLADPKGYTATIAATNPRVAEATAAVAPPVAPAAAGPAVVQIYWPPQKLKGGKPKVKCDGFHVADLENRRFVVLNVAPGSHAIGFHNKSFSFVFDAGRKYFLRASAEGLGKPFVRMASPEEATSEIQQGSVTANDPKRTFSTECKAPPVRTR
jgi:hypothetical protein